MLIPIGLWYGCSKEPAAPSGSPDPVFTAKFMVDSAAYNISAGVDGYYMFTGYHVDPYESFVSTGRFAIVDCATDSCPKNLQVEFRESKKDQTPSPNSLFREGEYFYTDSTNFFQLDSMITVAIQWIDEQGNILRSDNLAQPQSSNFVVNSVEAYQKNTNGQPTKKLTVDFSCRISNFTHTIVKHISGKLITAAAYKEP